MASEKFANLAETTLASSYTSGGASITVASATGFPTAGVFRVRLGNTNKTVFRVDSVSGATFTGGAEANDGNASGGDAVVQVISRQALERFLQSPDAGTVAAFAGVSGASRFGPIWAVTPLDQSAWSWVNQGLAVVTQGGGIVQLSVSAATGTNLRLRVKAAPTPPYTITAGILAWFAQPSSLTSLQAVGIYIRESSSGKLSGISRNNYTFATANAPGSVAAANFNSPTSWNAVIGTERQSGFLGSGAPFWLRMVDDLTNLKFYGSIDNVNFYSIASILRGSFMTTTPGGNQVGIAISNQEGATDASASIFSWEEGP